MSVFSKATNVIKAKLYDKPTALKPGTKPPAPQPSQWDFADIRAVLYECSDYFDNRADADYEGEERGFVPNEEMRLKTEIDELLAKLPKPPT